MPTSAALFPGDLAHAFPASQISQLFSLLPLLRGVLPRGGSPFRGPEVGYGGCDPQLVGEMGTTARFGNVKGLREGQPKECGDGEGCVATPQVGGMPGLGATKVVRNEATKGPREWLSIYTGGQTSGRSMRPVTGDA